MLGDFLAQRVAIEPEHPGGSHLVAAGASSASSISGRSSSATIVW